MKKLLFSKRQSIALLVVFLLISISSVKAQDSIDINNIPLDVSKPKPINRGESKYIKIVNVNKDLYDVIINGNKISYNTGVPAALTSIAFPSVIPFSNKLNITAASPNTDSTKIHYYEVPPHPHTCSNLIKEQKNIVTKEVNLFKLSTSQINAVIQFYNYLAVIQKNCINNAKATIEQKNNEARRIFNSTDTADMRKYMLGRYLEVQSAYLTIQKALDSIDFIINHKLCSETQTALTRINYSSRERDFLGFIDKVYSQVQDMIMNDQASPIINRFLSINESNFTVTSETIKAKNADKIEFTVDIKPKSWVPCEATETRFKVKYRVKGGVKVDFSTGIFGNFGSNSFHSNTYFISATDTIKQVNTFSKSLIPSIGALMHVYYRMGGMLDVGLVLGASLTTDFTITNFHGGVSFMLNVDNEILNRIALSVGSTLRYVKDLSAAYHVGSAVDANATIDELEVGKYKWGGFTAITWNLTKK